MKSETLVVKYSTNTRCECGGLVAFEGSYTRRLPVGLGFVPGNGGRFQMDFMAETGWAGECMKCLRKVWAWQTRRHVTKYPRGINAQLRALAGKAGR